MNRAADSLQKTEFSDGICKEITVFNTFIPFILGFVTMILGWAFFWIFSLAVNEYFSSVNGFLI